MLQGIENWAIYMPAQPRKKTKIKLSSSPNTWEFYSDRIRFSCLKVGDRVTIKFCCFPDTLLAPGPCRSGKKTLCWSFVAGYSAFRWDDRFLYSLRQLRVAGSRGNPVPGGAPKASFLEKLAEKVPHCEIPRVKKSRRAQRCGVRKKKTVN